MNAPSMDHIDVDRLRFYDLRGAPAILTDYFDEYALLIFLRHLA
jgi:hypothetical protein